MLRLSGAFAPDACEARSVSFVVDLPLLESARERLSSRELFWVLGGAGSGKSSLCRELALRGLDVVDMDARIYGSFQGRFDPNRHPANWAWVTAESSLGFLLSMGWSEFDAFHRAALVEYLDLLADELHGSVGPTIADGGGWHPAVLVEAIPADRVVCVSARHLSSADVWEADESRLAMRGYMESLPNPDAAWSTFLRFDKLITQTLDEECAQSGVRVLFRDEKTSVDTLADQALAAFGLRADSNESPTG